MKSTAVRFAGLACSLFCVLSTGCVRGPMSFHSSTRLPERTLCSNDGTMAPTPLGATNIEPATIVQGSPNRVVDGLGWVMGVPRKFILWNSRVDNHNVQPETVAEVATFAKTNKMDGVCVRVNQYAPGDEWQRLTANDRVSPGWRYTMGALSLVRYTLLPGRIFGGDQYNPYTNSVYVYSDVPALAMEAAAYAKDVQSRTLPGTYAAVNEIPVLSIWHETVNTRDTLAYLQSHGTEQDHRDGLAILYPNYGAAVGGSVGTVLGATPVFEVGGAIVGHISGRQKAYHVIPEEFYSADSRSSDDRSGKAVKLNSDESVRPVDNLIAVANQ